MSASPRKRASTASPSFVLPPGVTEDELGKEMERDKNRRTLNELKEAFARNYTANEEFKQSATAQLEVVMSQNRQLMQELAQVKRDGMLNASSDTLSQELSVVKQTLKSELGSLNERNRVMAGELDQFKKEHAKIKTELQGNSEHTKRLTDKQREMNELRSGTRSENQFSRVEAKSDLTSMELRQLRAQLLERGVLAPPPCVVEPEEQEAERVPVGTLDLGQDVFTARLLLRLGFMKAHKAQAGEEESSCLEDGWSDHDSQKSFLASENVTGIRVPEVEEGTNGYNKLMYGWVTICGATFFIQILILLIMLENGLEMSGDCFVELPSGHKWWLLHLSKALAMMVAGGLMGKELMDVVNYWMVAELLMPTRDVEVTITALLRVLMTFVVVSANVAIFLHLTNPAVVWTNMCALGFIVNLGKDVMLVSKSGVFGHHVGKTITTLNFQLSFMTVYPSWFIYVRFVSLSLSAAVVVTFATISFSAADSMCAP